MQQEKEKLWAGEVFAEFEKKMEKVAEKSKDKIPALAIDGVHDDRGDGTKEWRADDGLNWWTNGFWGGMLWMLYAETGKERYGEIARISERKLDACFESFLGLHHDVGFMWMPTAVADYRLTGNREARKEGCTRLICWRDGSTRRADLSGPGMIFRVPGMIPGAGPSLTACLILRCFTGRVRKRRIPDSARLPCFMRIRYGRILSVLMDR